MSDLVGTLRAYGGNDERDYRHQAANRLELLGAEITRLQKELDSAREAAADNLRMRTEDLRAELAQAREDALEEAAKVAEQLPMLRAVSPVHIKSTSPQDVADFIRALKDKEVAG